MQLTKSLSLRGARVLLGLSGVAPLWVPYVMHADGEASRIRDLADHRLDQRAAPKGM